MGNKHDDGQFIKWVVLSDLHGPYLSQDAFSIFLQIWKQEKFDQLVLLGDLCDFQLSASHKQRIEIMNPVKPKIMDLSEEIDFTVENILKPLRKSKPKTPIMFLPGNHERRVIRQLRDNPDGLGQLVEVSARRRKSVWLQDLLEFDTLGIDMEDGEDNYGVYYLRHRYGVPVAMLHGYKTNKTRCSNYLDYFQCHVLTGHTHKDDYVVRNTRLGRLVACETMCMRSTRGIEYLAEGHDPGWVNGFVTIWINKETAQVWIKQHRIENGVLEFKGRMYEA